MSITDELREWAHGFNGLWRRNEEMLLAIANRIDAEHEEKVSYWQGACYEDGYKEGLADNEDLERENAKLRELVQDIYGVMWACAEQRCTHRHDGCFRVHGNHGDICVSERCWYEDRMSELGIEV